MLLRCPTKDPFHNLRPARFTCRACGAEYLIPSDELANKHHRCHRCRKRVVDVARRTNPAYDELALSTMGHGVSDALVIATEEIPVEEHFRALCEDPRCPNYGSSVHCPPHARSPTVFRELLRSYRYGFVFRFDIPAEALGRDARREIGRLLHDTTAEVERQAIALGFVRAAGFSSGGCKRTYCNDHSDCAARYDESGCRFPDWARTSLSGMGVNTQRLLQAAGWLKRSSYASAASETQHGAMLVGLVLLE